MKFSNVVRMATMLQGASGKVMPKEPAEGAHGLTVKG